MNGVTGDGHESASQAIDRRDHQARRRLGKSRGDDNAGAYSGGQKRNEAQNLSAMSGVERWTTDLDSVMSDPDFPVYFDAQSTLRRADAVKAAATAGKHVYCEKPTAVDTKTAVELHYFCEDKGVKSGVVQDKLWLPGLVKLKRALKKATWVEYFR